MKIKGSLSPTYTGRLKLGMLPNSELEILEISEFKRTSNGERIALCKCHHTNPLTRNECGKIFETTVSNLVTGNTKTCGCSHNIYPDAESVALAKKWFSMKDRCNNPNSQSYADYGGRGIKISPEWDDDFESRVKFIKDGINKGFILGQEIDRIENDSGYSPDNVRFTDRRTQNNNKRNNHVIEVGDLKMSVGEWAKTLRVNRVLLANKLRAVEDESDYIHRLIRKELRITDRIPYELCVKRKERSDKGSIKSTSHT